MAPSRLRKSAGAGSLSDSLTLTLGYRPPLDWAAMHRFLAGRATAGVERVRDGSYLRTVRAGAARGWIKVEPARGRNALVVDVSSSLAPVLPALLFRLRGLFDLDARPDVIAAHLGADARLAAAVRSRPGVRVPGAVDGFELAVRAILGQRISVAAATTLAGRLAEAFGEAIETPFPQLCRLSPRAECLAEVEPGRLVALGIAAPRARATCELAKAVCERRVELVPGSDPELTIQRLEELPGIGAWTAHYIAMRALRWPDAFPASDLGLLKASGARSPRELGKMAEAWRPWRAYAAMIFWNHLSSTLEAPSGG
jgi:AraC family transcriptional regulator of adaptative response / DNA-3-methyladenine glycosylase II